MKKNIILTVIALLLSLCPVFGQIIYTEEDMGYHPRAEGDGGVYNVLVPIQNVQLDQYKYEHVPVGGGVLLFIGLGGAYLFYKKKK